MRNKTPRMALIGTVMIGLMLIGTVLRDSLLRLPEPNSARATELVRIHGWDGFARTTVSVTQTQDVSGMVLAILIMALLTPAAIVLLQRTRPINSLTLAYAASGVTIGFLALLVVIGTTSGSVMAVGSYGNDVPNYGASLVINPAGAHCNTCHAAGSSPSGGTVTQFGASFASANHLWTVGLAQTDADGDGFSNGEELQDPTGATVGNTAAADPYGDTALLSSPGISTATYVNNNSGYGTRGYPVPPTVTNLSLINGAMIAGNVVVTASIRYAGLSKEVWTLKNSGGTIVYTSTINYAPLTGTNYNNKHCLGANAPATSCAAWDSTVLPNGNYTVTVTAYDRRATSLGGSQTHALARSVTINNVVAADADVQISKAASASLVVVHSSITFTIVVHNNGPLSATNVLVTDTMPSGLTILTRSTTQGSRGGSPTLATCSLNTVANGGSATVTLGVTTTITGTFINTAHVGAIEIDPTSANNQSSVTVTAAAQLFKVFLPIILR